ncbi:MAG TPA: dipeptidase [candidate division Zixibacteria bacterium]|nr:dipeptidase [candidate division Zixibacteria bacterium]HER00681.1 dipeptidase [candidate division Zixibacteria bacterium]
MKALEYADKNFDNFVQVLIELLKIPSVSAQSEHKDDMKKCAEFLVDKLRWMGLEPKIFETPGHPVVYAEYINNPQAPTALIYGHYDVQPVDPLELWESPPFEPKIVEDKMYARGSADDKGQIMIHAAAIESFLKTEGSVPINFKIIFEGEEEIQSAHLDTFLEEHKDMLKCDLAIISDTAMFGRDLPALTVSLRGIAIAEIKVVGPNRDLHSGSYGGAVPNPIHELCNIIAKLHDDDHKVTVPGFYDDVVDVADWEREESRKLPFDEKAFLLEVGSKGLVGEKGYTTLERKSARPTLEINGIYGGYSGEGTKTIIPSWAGAKITMRLVPKQDPVKICGLLQKYLTELSPAWVDVQVTTSGGAKPGMVSRENPMMQAAADAIQEGFGKEPLYTREGGSIPIVNVFKEILGVDTILFGFAQPDSNEHSPNEWFDLRDFKRGINSTIHLYKKLAEMKV